MSSEGFNPAPEAPQGQPALPNLQVVAEASSPAEALAVLQSCNKPDYWVMHYMTAVTQAQLSNRAAQGFHQFTLPVDEHHLAAADGLRGQDGVGQERLALWPGRIVLWSNHKLSCRMDTTGDFHVYRLVTQGKDIKGADPISGGVAPATARVPGGSLKV